MTTLVSVTARMRGVPGSANGLNFRLYLSLGQRGEGGGRQTVGSLEQAIDAPLPKRLAEKGLLRLQLEKAAGLRLARLSGKLSRISSWTVLSFWAIDPRYR
jgi:hypothetical protein